MIIDGREIGSGHAPYIIAEISGEHKGSLTAAQRLISAAAVAGADAVKLQLYDPYRLAQVRGGWDKWLPDGPWKGRTLLGLYREAHTPREWFPDLFAYAKEIGIAIFSSVFDEDGVDYLETLCSPCYKISSFDLTNLPLIRKAASTGKPLIISTGMGSSDDVYSALKVASADERPTSRGIPQGYVALLHCVSSYPCPIEHANLHRIDAQFGGLRQFREFWDGELEIGLSDHTLGTTAAIVATALGASIIEKHITLSRADGGPDASFSLEPQEFAKLVQDVKDAYASLGAGGERPASEETYRSLRVKG